MGGTWAASVSSRPLSLSGAWRVGSSGSSSVRSVGSLTSVLPRPVPDVSTLSLCRNSAERQGWRGATRARCSVDAASTPGNGVPDRLSIKATRQGRGGVIRSRRPRPQGPGCVEDSRGPAPRGVHPPARAGVQGRGPHQAQRPACSGMPTPRVSRGGPRAGVSRLCLPCGLDVHAGLQPRGAMPRGTKDWAGSPYRCAQGGLCDAPSSPTARRPATLWSLSLPA